MAENLDIKIGADVAPAVTSLKKVSAELLKTAESEKQFAAASQRTAAALKSVVPGANQAGNALMNLGRIAQDAPFGFIGITNNINPLLESFQRLKTETGSTKNAISALVSGLAGGAGLGLAVSVATGLLTVFGDRIFKIGSDTKKAKEETDEYEKSLSSISAGLSEEATRIAVLVKAVQSETLSKEQRNAAVKELQKLNPDYFGDLKEEAGLIGKLQVAYTAYIQSLKTQFAAKALDKQIAELFDKKARIEAEIDPTVSNDANKDIAKILSRYRGEFEKLGGLKALMAIPFDKAELSATEVRLKELNRLIQDIQQTKTYDPEGAKTIKDLDDINLRIDGLLARRAQLENFDISIDKGKAGSSAKREEDALQKRISQLEALNTATGLLKIEEQELFDLRMQMASRDAAKNGLNPGQLQRTLASLQTQADNSQFELGIKAGLLLPEAPEINTDLALLGKVLKPLNVKVNVDTKAASEKLMKFTDTMEAALNSAVSTLATGLGEVLGEALSGGNPLAATLQLIAESLIQLGKAAVAAGISMITLKKLALQPGLAIAAGIAAIAVGTALKSKIPKFAEGGIVTGPTVGMIGEGGQPEVIFPLSKLNQFINGRNHSSGEGMVIEHRVDGTELVLIMNRVNRQWGSSLR